MERTVRDTDPAAERVRSELFRRMPPWRKAALVEEACRETWQVLLAGIRARHPEAAEEEILWRARVAWVGEDLARAAWGGPEGCRGG